MTVVIASHQGAGTILDAVGDVIGQTVSDLELLVVVDGHDRDTVALLRKVDDPRLRVLEQEHAGPSPARNRGAKTARSEWLVFLDDDDRVDPCWLESLLSAANPTTGIVCCGALRVNEATGAQETLLPSPLGPGYRDVVAMFLCGTYMVRRSIFEEVGGFDEEIRYGENYELGIRLTWACDRLGLEVRAVNATLVRYLIRERKAPTRRFTAHDRYRSAILQYERNPAAMAADRELRASTLGIAGVWAARSGEVAEARKQFWRAALAKPWAIKPWARFAATTVPPLARRVWLDPLAGNVGVAAPHAESGTRSERD